MTTKSYARIAAVGHDNIRTNKMVEVVEESERFLTGWVVDIEGARTNVLWVIDQTTILKRTPLRMNRTYGTLEVRRPGLSSKMVS